MNRSKVGERFLQRGQSLCHPDFDSQGATYALNHGVPPWVSEEEPRRKPWRLQQQGDKRCPGGDSRSDTPRFDLRSNHDPAPGFHQQSHASEAGLAVLDK